MNRKLHKICQFRSDEMTNVTASPHFTGPAEGTATVGVVNLGYSKDDEVQRTRLL
jgi:hypothetical protein